MSRTFYGKNNLSAGGLFESRAKYEREAYNPSPNGPRMVKDLSLTERQYYGAIDTEGNPVIPNESKLIRMGNSANAPRIFDFMVGMFIDTKSRVDFCHLNNSVNVQIPAFKDIHIKQAYKSPSVAYTNYLSDIILEFNLLIGTDYKFENILNFVQYVENFFHFLSTKKVGVPITLSGWMVSNKCSIFYTGLGLSIDDSYKISSDQEKIDNYIDNESFEYYHNLLMNMGFSIVKQSPWVWVPDLQSPAAVGYLSNSGINNVKKLFDSHYIKTKDIDILYIIELLIKYYNIFVFRNEYQKFFVPTTCPKVTLDGNRRSNWEFYKRQPIVVSQGLGTGDIPEDNPSLYGTAALMFPETYWTTFYLYCRNFENGNPYEPGRIDEINDHAIFLQKSLDKTAATDYINKKMRKFIFKKPFGYSDLVKRLKEKEAFQRKADGIQANSDLSVPQSSGGGY